MKCLENKNVLKYDEVIIGWGKEKQNDLKNKQKKKKDGRHYEVFPSGHHSKN